MQIIKTKFLGPTNTRGSRIKASCDAGSVTLGWDHALNAEQNHLTAIKALIEKQGWDNEYYGTWHTGSDKTGAYTAVCHNPLV